MHKSTIIYQARLPLKRTLRIVERGGGEFIEGEYGQRTRDVFRDWYEESLSKAGVDPPHIVYANWPDSSSNILDFTAQWGPIAERPMSPGWIRRGDVLLVPGHPEHESVLNQIARRFVIPVAAWRKTQKQFRALCNLIAGAADLEAGKQKVVQEYHRMRASSPDLFPSGVKPDLEYRPEEGLVFVFRPSSLWEAFALMLWRDFSENSTSLRVCRNPKCNRLFRGDRPNRKFCCAECAHRYHNLASYHRRGKIRRRKRRERKTDGDHSGP